MELFLQSVSLVLIAVILGLMLKGQDKVFAPLLSLCACIFVLLGLVRYLQPLMELLEKMVDLADVSAQMLEVLLKAVGISIIAQLAELICTDAGQSALGKAIGLLSNGVILWISIPLVEELLELLQEVLGKI